MEKTEVIVDTCFLQKLSSEGKVIDNIKRVLDELEYIPVVHPYIYEHELSLHSYFVSLVEDGYIKVMGYDEFQKDAIDKQTYEAYYDVLYEEMRLTLEASSITVKEIEAILKAMRERNAVSGIKAVWRENHPV